MDKVRIILTLMAGQKNPITMRHISYRTGISAPTLTGLMMGMITRGYVREVTGATKSNTTAERCGCACCRRKEDRETTTTLDRRLYSITTTGRKFLE